MGTVALFMGLCPAAVTASSHATKLRAEIDSAMVDPESIPENRVLRDLPYLNAVISEGMSCDLAWKASSYVWDFRRLAYI